MTNRIKKACFGLQSKNKPFLCIINIVSVLSVEKKNRDDQSNPYERGFVLFYYSYSDAKSPDRFDNLHVLKGRSSLKKWLDTLGYMEVFHG